MKMMSIFEAKVDPKTNQFAIRELKPYHKMELKYCKFCGEGLVFGLDDLGEYSTYTGNKMLHLVSYCPKEHGRYQLIRLYQCKKDGLLYTTDFTSLEEYREKI